MTTKNLSDKYKDPKKIAHKVLADRIKEETGEEIHVNERMEFVHIKDPLISKMSNAL